MQKLVSWKCHFLGSVILLRSADFSNAWLHKCHGHSFRRTSVREDRVMFFSWCLSLCQSMYSEAGNLLSKLFKRDLYYIFPLSRRQPHLPTSCLLLLMELLNSLCLVFKQRNFFYPFVLLLPSCSPKKTLFPALFLCFTWFLLV